MSRKTLVGSAALMASAFFWATAYVSVKQLVAAIPPCLLLAWRFSLAAIILLIVSLPKMKLMNRKLLKAGCAMGVALFVEFFTFTVGLKYTTASRSSFIIASYIILLPIAYFIIRRKRPEKRDIGVAALCMVGVCFIMANNMGTFQMGDILCGICAAAYAVHVVLSAQYSREFDTGLLNFLQIAVSALLATVCSVVLGETGAAGGDMPFAAVAYLAIICTILPYFLCLFGMKFVSTTTSGILLSFESVFATILAVILLHEQLSWQFIVGGCIIVFAFILSALLEPKEAGQET